MSEDLLDIPIVPPEIRTAAHQGLLVAFVGAGVSQLAGGPSWSAFARRLLEGLAARGLLSFGEFDQLANLSARKTISIAVDIWEASGTGLDLREFLGPIPTADKAPPVYRDLYSLGVPFVTTNYDEWLDVLAENLAPPSNSVGVSTADPTTAPRPPRSKVFYGKDLLTIETLLQGGNVVHLHGSVRAPDTMILTTGHYLAHYGEPAVRLFLEELFGRYTVLFVGYGLEEDEILEHVVRKRPGLRARSHFRLFPRYSHQGLLAQHLAAYSLKHCGAQLIEYCTDRQGHAQLEAVIAAWAQELRPEIRSQSYLEKIRIIDRALGE